MVFDVDGVLVDTSRSYTLAVVRAVQWLLVRDGGIADDGPAVTVDDVRQWREAGGWNNDWDLTTGMYRWLAAAPGGTTTARRGAAEPATTAAARSLDELRARASAGAPRSWEEVRAIFDEFYNGSAVSAARHGLAPRVGIERGLCAEESILLRPALVDALRGHGIAKFGVVTGRSDEDWAQVSGRIPLPPGTVVSTDAHGKKPDPLPLKRVLDLLGAKGFVAVGDTVDDVRMVKAYLPLKGSAPGVSVALCAADRESVFRDAGADRCVRSLDELPAVVVSVRS